MASMDVRPDLAAGREPYDRIMETVAKLSPTESLELVAPFEPLPLYHVMELRGFEHMSRRAVDGSWHITFRRVTDEE